MSTDDPQQLPQPQDPWEGAADTAIAAMATQPLPAQSPAPAKGFRPGVASPQAQPAWQEPYSSQIYPPQRSGKGLMIFMVVVALLVFGGGAAFAISYLTSQQSRAITPSASVNPRVSGLAVFEPAKAKVGDCFSDLSVTSQPDYRVGACNPGSFKVLKVVTGPTIPKNADGDFDTSTSHAVCDGLPYTQVFKYRDLATNHDLSKDVFICLLENK